MLKTETKNYRNHAGFAICAALLFVLLSGVACSGDSGDELLTIDDPTNNRPEETKHPGDEAPDAPDEEESSFSPVGPVPEYDQRTGDPVAGYRAFVNEDYVSCGIPASLYGQFFGAAPASMRVSGREGRNATLPYTFTAATTSSGVDVVAANCMTCHATHLNGEIVIGLGNTTIDYTQADMIRVLRGMRGLVDDPDERAELDKFLTRMTAVEPFVTTDTVGVNPADNLTAALLAHIDPETMQWHEEPQFDLEPYKQIVPLRVPPFWWMSKKNAMFYTTLGRGSHTGFMMAASMLCADSVEELERIDSYFNDVRAYITSIEPPEYPWEIDNALAERGKPIFEENCSQCHGTYGATPEYPNLVLSIEEIGTDPELTNYNAESMKPFYDWFSRSYYGRDSQPKAAPGYIAPPLDGVWAIAPYFHNGSVPNIEAVLNSELRPKYWIRESVEQNEDNYDKERLGWKYVASEHGKDDEPSFENRKLIYDTTRRGYSNKGHQFGDHLTDDERRAVIEYLKTL